MHKNFSAKLRLVVIAGTGSNTGKTTLLCDLLRALTPQEPWEAIKLTRGHYRSCGKDPHACCVSDLLGAQPVVRSGRAETYALGKDTGRYWEAGAQNVHWVIAASAQVEAGIKEALARVQTGRVLIEGTSVTQFVKPDFTILAARNAADKPKPSARVALRQGWIDAVYLSGAGESGQSSPWFNGLPVYTAQAQAELLARLKQVLCLQAA